MTRSITLSQEIPDGKPSGTVVAGHGDEPSVRLSDMDPTLPDTEDTDERRMERRVSNGIPCNVGFLHLPNELHDCCAGSAQRQHQIKLIVTDKASALHSMKE